MNGRNLKRKSPYIIDAALRKKSGEIRGFKLKDNTFLEYQTALREAKQGNLVGINLYPKFTQEVLAEEKQQGILAKLIQKLTGQ
ncbi:hypothetical protein [Desulforamulus aeronauticus]|uniref:Uncharacterized protein n=1 Tax=Desulforamulus aeronauticus DSM 10349 TaxID=1121421 RepID=A0A1M6TPB9_9FIRM|nr:hypothetical protein [Desulforamulus aeronauticus]SHK58770.1 hypothetical protein SAMN02745123_02408 [Desulforamulus aeronauticus DSM 10349]